MLKIGATFFILLLLVSSTFCQNHVNLRIQLDNTIEKDIELIEFNDGLNYSFYTDSVEEGVLGITKQLYGPKGQFVVQFKNEFIYFFVGKGPSTIHFYTDTTDVNSGLLYNLKGDVQAVWDTTHNRVYLELLAYKPEISTRLYDYMDKNAQEIRSNDSVNRIYIQYLEDYIDRELEFFEKYSDEYFAFWTFKQSVLLYTNAIKEPTNYLNRLLASMNRVFPEKFTTTKEGQSIDELIRGRMETIRVGDKALEFEIEILSGEKFTRDDFLGKYVLIDFWATWCVPCLKQMPEIIKLRADYATDVLEIIGVSADNDIKPLLKYIDENELNWIQVFDKKGDFVRSYGVTAFPTAFLIDPNGNLIYHSIGPLDINQITAILDGDTE